MNQAIADLCLTEARRLVAEGHHHLDVVDPFMRKIPLSISKQERAAIKSYVVCALLDDKLARLAKEQGEKASKVKVIATRPMKPFREFLDFRMQQTPRGDRN